MSDTIHLSDIFHSSVDTRRWVSYGDLADLINTGVIALSVIDLQPIPTVKDVYTLMVKSATDTLPTYNPVLAHQHIQKSLDIQLWLIEGGHRHQWLGFLAQAFLLSHNKKPVCELTIGGGKSDVVSDDLHWLIECGDTQADRVHRYLTHVCQRFAVLPFFDIQTGPRLYVFDRGENWYSWDKSKDAARIANEGVII